MYVACVLSVFCFDLCAVVPVQWLLMPVQCLCAMATYAGASALNEFTTHSTQSDPSNITGCYQLETIISKRTRK